MVSRRQRAEAEVPEGFEQEYTPEPEESVEPEPQPEPEPEPEVEAAVEPEVEAEPAADDTPVDSNAIRLNGLTFIRRSHFWVCTDRDFHPLVWRSKGRTPITFDDRMLLKVWGSQALEDAMLEINGVQVQLGQRSRRDWFEVPVSQETIDAVTGVTDNVESDSEAAEAVA